MASFAMCLVFMQWRWIDRVLLHGESMREYNIFEAVYLSFFSKSLYRNVAKQWGGKSILYLLLIVALSWIVFTIQVQLAINVFYASNSDKIVEQIPVITIKNGIVSTPENKPYFIHSPDNKVLLAVIDTTGKYTTLQQAHAMVLVTPTTIYSRSDTDHPNEIRERQIPNTVNMMIDPISINHHLSHFVSFAWLFIFGFCVMVGFIYRFVQAFVYSVVGKLMAIIFNIPLNYGQIFQIAMVSITPVLVASVIIDVFGIRFAYESIFFFILAMGYLLFGMWSNLGLDPNK